MVFKKETLERLIFIENKSYREIGRIFNCSDNQIRNKAKSLGIELPNRKPISKSENNCVVCGSITKNPKYCSLKCQGTKVSKDKYSEYLANQEEYCRADYNLRVFKPHILKEQDSKCKICDMPDSWNGQNLVFVLDHIDGNAANNNRSNLRMICPNCDSQLPTFKSKNKNSARKNRYLSNT